MPNRRRRRLSTATSAVAALAVVSPFAISAITDLTKPAPQPREFRSAAMVTDLPNELMSALSQGLSQFGINLPAAADQHSDRRLGRYADDVDRSWQPRVIGPDVGLGHRARPHTGPAPASALTPPRRPLLSAQLTRARDRTGPNDALLANPALTSPALPHRAVPRACRGWRVMRGGGQPGSQPDADQPDGGDSRRSDDAAGDRP